MNWMKRVEEKRNSRLICLRDLSSPDGSRRRRTIGCNDLFFNGHSSSHAMPDITSSLCSPPSDSSPAQHHQHHQQQQQQLGKLKRFLATLERLGADISPVIGHEVNSLVRALIDNAITVEDFHDQLHRTTNFPLRPFVIPFLKSNLPILQEEVQSQLSELPHLSPSPSRDLQQQKQLLLLSNEANVLRSADCQIGAAQTKSPTPPDDKDRNRKRTARDLNYNKAPENGHQNDVGAVSPTAKRLRTSCSPTHQNNSHSLDDAINAPYSADGASGGQFDSLPYKASNGLSGIPPLGDASTVRLLTQCLDRDQEHKNRNRFYSGCSRNVSVDPFDEDWNYVETILQCIVGLAERCQRALHVLQERGMKKSKNSLTSKSIWNNIPLSSSSSSSSSLSSSSFCNRILMNGTVTKKQPPVELSKAEVQQNDEQGLDLVRCAEGAVNDVKRQAMFELQKAFAAAEAKASEALSSDRLDIDRTLDDVRERTRIEVAELLNRQVDCNESCWNCGRVASETCSGCNRARYCGIFCQHRHWENHHRVCGNASPSYLCKSPPTRPDPRGYLYCEGGASSPNHAHSGTALTEDYCNRGSGMAVTSTVQPPSEIRERLQTTKALYQSETQLIVNVKQETI